MTPSNMTPSEDLNAHLGGLSVADNEGRSIVSKRRSDENLDETPRKRPRSRINQERPPQPVAKAFDPALLPGYPNANELRVRQKATARMIPPYWTDFWTYGRELGSGTFGTARLFYRLDPVTQTVVDRISVKDNFVSPDNWALWTMWHGDPRDPTKRVHIEIQTLSDIAKARERHNAVGAAECLTLRSHCHNDDLYFYRVITDFYQHGDLGGAIVRRPFADPEFMMADRPTDGFDVAEAIIWKWLEDLAKACILMSSIEVNDDHNPRLCKWLIHRDIKPANIFLGAADPSEWPSYPKAALGDFGCSVYTDFSDPHNPNVYNQHVGTPGYRPAELTAMYDARTLAKSNYGPLTPACNIWGIGCSLIRLINRCENPRGPNPSYDSQFNCDVLIDLNARNYYSPQLIHTLRMCTRFQSHERITPEELLKTCRRWTGLSENPDEVDLANGMRTRMIRPDDEADLALNWLLFPSAAYRLGFALQNREGWESTDVESPTPRRHGDNRP